MPRIVLDGSFKLRVTMSPAALLLFLPAFVSSTSQDLPWALITAAPAAATKSLDRRDYDTANSHLYGYTSVGMDGTKTKWSAKMCDDIAPTMLIETFQNIVFGLCWAVSTSSFLGLYATTVSGDYITACSGRIAIGTSSTWDCSAQGNCIFNTIYPDLASTSPTLAATCAQNTAGNTYIHAVTFPTTSPTGPAPTKPGSTTGTSGGGVSGPSTSDMMALAIGLGVGIPTLLIMLCAWLWPCKPRRTSRWRHGPQMHHSTDGSTGED